MYRDGQVKTFQVVEIGKNIRRSYIRVATDEDMSAYLNGRFEMEGYIEGLGGDKTYSINAWYVGEESQYYVDYDRIYARMGKVFTK